MFQIMNKSSHQHTDLVHLRNLKYFYPIVSCQYMVHELCYICRMDMIVITVIKITFSHLPRKVIACHFIYFHYFVIILLFENGFKHHCYQTIFQVFFYFEYIEIQFLYIIWQIQLMFLWQPIVINKIINLIIETNILIIFQ